MSRGIAVARDIRGIPFFSEIEQDSIDNDHTQLSTRSIHEGENMSGGAVDRPLKKTG